MKSLAIDVDNVLADTMSEFCKIASKEFGYTISKKIIKSDKIVGSIPASYDMIRPILDNIWINYMNLPPIEADISEKIRRLKSHNLVIKIATSRPRRSFQYVKAWLTKMDIEFDSFVGLNYGQSKADVDADFLIDDSYQHALDFANRKPSRISFLYDQPWNYSNATTSRIMRISTLLDVIQKVKS